MKKLNKIFAVLLTAAIGFTAAGCSGSSDNAQTSADNATAATTTAASASDTQDNDVSVNNNTSAAETEAAPETPAELVTVRIGVPAADATSLPESAALANNLGFLDEELEKAGFKAEYIPFGQGGTAVNEAFASGQLDYAFMGDAPEVIGKANGLDVELIASLNSEAAMGIVAGPASGIESAADLKDKKVVIAFGTVTHKYLVDVLNANGLTIDDVQVINDIANAATLVATGDADALVSNGQGIFVYQAMGIGNVVETSFGTPEFSAQFFVETDRKFAAENPGSAKAIIKAIERTKNYAKENYQGVLNAFASDSIPAAVYGAVYPEELGFDKFSPEITETSKAKLASLSKFFTENGITVNEIDVDSFVNSTYYEEAIKEFYN